MTEHVHSAGGRLYAAGCADCRHKANQKYSERVQAARGQSETPEPLPTPQIKPEARQRPPAIVSTLATTPRNLAGALDHAADDDLDTVLRLLAGATRQSEATHPGAAMVLGHLAALVATERRDRGRANPTRQRSRRGGTVQRLTANAFKIA